MDLDNVVDNVVDIVLRAIVDTAIDILDNMGIREDSILNAIGDIDIDADTRTDVAEAIKNA